MSPNTSQKKHALIVGVTGITGHALAKHLLRQPDWHVSGISRRPPEDLPGMVPVSVDVTDKQATQEALSALKTTHVFFCAWLRQDSETENCRVNGSMLRNVLDAISKSGNKLEHAALSTGLKHYLGPFESYGKTQPETPFREEQPRLPFENFYYTQEDILFECAKRDGFTWSVHRPHTIIGWALGNAMNMGVTLAVYGAICKETGAPFVFPGSPEQFSAVTDVTDARILAHHMRWAATCPSASNQAMNIVNGDQFRWRTLWKVVAAGLDVEAAPYPGHADPLEARMKDAATIWRKIARKHDLAIDDVSRLVSWWHTDADLGRTMETFTSMTKSRGLGFLEYQDSEKSFLDLFEELRSMRIIPPRGT